MLKKVVYAGSNCPSFEQAKDFLLHLAEIDLDVKMVRRATPRIGEERLAQRDLLVATWDELPLADKGRSVIADVPDLAVVMTDGGRVQILPDQDEKGITGGKLHKPSDRPRRPTRQAAKPTASVGDASGARTRWRR